MKAPIFLIKIILSFLSFLLIGKGNQVFAQYEGGNADGHYSISKLDIVSCSALPAYYNVSIGGNADGHYSIAKLDIVSCSALPAYYNVSIGGNADGHYSIAKTDIVSCAVLPRYYNVQTGGAADGFSRLGPSSCLAVLPIELLYFTASLLNNEKVLCEWKTVSEINNDYFTVEKTKDTKRFETIGTTKGAGNSTHTLYYAMTDYAPYQGTSYYRLKQTDYDGKYTYSDLVAVNLKGIDLISIYPNPSDDKFEYLVSTTENTKINITVIDVLGREIISSSELIKTGINELSLDISNLSAGIYALQIITESGLYKAHKQFVKK